MKTFKLLLLSLFFVSSLNAGTVLYENPLTLVIPQTNVANTGNDMLVRAAGIKIIEETVNITGTGAITASLLQLTGTVKVVNQWAEITAITTLTNATNVYATLWDGTNSVDLTADGLTLSTATVGSFFTKDKVSTDPYSANIADQCRLLETTIDRFAGRPFAITQKNGADTFIRFHLTTTDAPIDFTIKIVFEYIPANGGTLEFL